MRPTKATPALLDEIIKLLEVAVPLRAAADSVGVNRSTLARWRKSPTLGASLNQARAKGLVDLHLKGLAGGNGSAAARTLLERLDREHYGLVRRFEHTGKDGGPIKSVTAEGDMSQYSDDELRRIAFGDDDTASARTQTQVRVLTLITGAAIAP